MSALPSMSNRMLRAAVATEGNCRENLVATAGNSITTDAPLAGLDLAEAIDKALKRAGLTHKQAAAYMGLSPQQWSKQLTGQDKHQISFQRLLRLPHPFWFEFIALLGDPLQITISSEDMADLTLLRVIGLMEELGRCTLRLRGLRRPA